MPLKILKILKLPKCHKETTILVFFPKFTLERKMSSSIFFSSSPLLFTNYSLYKKKK